MPNSPERPPFAAIVLGGNTNGLGALRLLAQAGIETHAIVTDARDISRHSRYGTVHFHPGSDASGEALLAAVLAIDASSAVLVPITDRFVRAMNEARDHFPANIRFVLPEGPTLAQFLDKATEAFVLSAAGAVLPDTRSSLRGAPETVLAGINFPIILKPRTPEAKKALGAKNRKIEDLADARRFWDSHAKLLDGLIAQEYIAGDERALWVVDALYDRDSTLVQAFTFQKIWTSPARDGVTSLGVSKTNVPLIELASELGRRLGLQGPVDWDFKWDDRNRRYVYIELNPRLGLCHPFAAASGVPIAVAVYRMGAGFPVQRAIGNQIDGIYYWRLPEDLYSRRKSGESPFSILSNYLRMIPRRPVSAYFSWRDPQPGVVQLWRWLEENAIAAAKRFRGIQRRTKLP